MGRRILVASIDGDRIEHRIGAGEGALLAAKSPLKI
jgi:hypothetical protein